MQRRAFERIPTNLQTTFLSENNNCTGTVMNLSENGMFINTKLSFPFDSMLEIRIPLKEEILKVPVKVSRIVKTDDFYGAIGVELLNPPQNYLEFVNRLKST